MKVSHQIPMGRLLQIVQLRSFRPDRSVWVVRFGRNFIAGVYEFGIMGKGKQRMDNLKDSELTKKIFDSMPSMIFIVDDDVRLHEYNTAAAEFLSAERRSVLKHRGGDVLKCIHSTHVPEGCGHAPYCGDCVIRNSVNDAYKGKNVVRARSKMEVMRGGEKKDIYAMITATAFTYKEKNLVLLVIEDISEIAELQRMIPICSVCHKIRDEEKVWSRVESYFKKQWDVDFSHSYCPDCLKEEMKKIKENNQKR